ncbi:hypothetical protein [Bartonella tribocorum]|uniref:DUF4142 domain-containing protein n=1 Tax=Bartonella tribocorum TaxID=85701 RepID=A0A2M6UVQ5_9HYPH|nr:hypothetical protein [Bartonella tribocorum]PIT70174.1 hypothetical protein CER18_00185 [Bartonella tribocorum]
MFKLALCLLFLFPFVSYAQEQKQETDKLSFTSALIANYLLTEDLLVKLEKIEKKCKNLSQDPEKISTKKYSTTDSDSIENDIAYISSKQGLVNILKENNLTPKDFIIALHSLQETLIVLTNGESSTYEKNAISSSNIEFAKNHMYRMIKILKGNC